MLRQAPRFLLSRASTSVTRWSRPFSTDPSAETTGDSKFVDAGKASIPNMDPSKTPSAHMAPRPPTPSTIPSKLTVNLLFPYGFVLYAKKADMVIVPATTGQMDVLPGHVTTIAKLKPGLMTIHEGNDVIKYFLSSGGFVFVYKNTIAEIMATKATRVDRIEQPEEVSAADVVRCLSPGPIPFLPPSFRRSGRFFNIRRRRRGNQDLAIAEDLDPNHEEEQLRQIDKVLDHLFQI